MEFPLIFSAKRAGAPDIKRLAAPLYVMHPQDLGPLRGRGDGRRVAPRLAGPWIASLAKPADEAFS